MKTTIIEANSIAHIDMARELYLAYEKELNVDLCFQGFADELHTLPGKYAPPDGALLLAIEQTQAIGCVAMRRFSVTDAEMKRLFVRPHARHFGAGRQLAVEIIERARAAGYRRIVLDTLDTMSTARALYESLGFVATDAYYANPIPGALYFAKELA